MQRVKNTACCWYSTCNMCLTDTETGEVILHLYQLIIP